MMATASFPVPDTISLEAQAALRELGPAIDRPVPTNYIAARELLKNRTELANKEAAQKHTSGTEQLSIAGVPVLRVTPRGYKACKDDKLGVFIHGGAYTLGHPEDMFHAFAPTTSHLGLRVVAVDYRLAPEHPFPSAINDCYAVYTELLKEYAAKNLVMWGDSAGAALALAVLLRAQEDQVPLPAALALHSPWSDIDTSKGDTYATLAPVEPFLPLSLLENSVKAYLSEGVDPKDPQVSPVYGSFNEKFPPTLIAVGTRDIFLSNSVRLYRAIKAAGVKVELSGWEGMWHSFHGQLQLPEAQAAQEEVARHLSKHLY